jgi:hypothetical protein
MIKTKIGEKTYQFYESGFVDWSVWKLLWYNNKINKFHKDMGSLCASSASPAGSALAQ